MPSGSGRVQAGERLPSSRGLARELGLSRGLVQDCYAQLLAEGYLTARPGSATVVAPCAGAEPAVAVRVTPRPRLLADFGLGLPDLASFPRAEWLHALREACRTASTGSFGYEEKMSDRGSPGLDQLALATMIRSGHYDRHLRRMRAMYGRRREALVGALATHAPRVRLSGLAAGFHAVAHLPAPATEHAVIAAARDRSVGLYGMSTFRSDGATVPAQLILGFGNISERSIRAGIAAIGDLLDVPRGSMEVPQCP